MNKKRRIGDRSDGRRIRTLDPISSMIPFIMKTRSGASNLVEDTLDITEVERYLRVKAKSGYTGMGMLHFLIASYVRVISQYPGVNRFCVGQRVYARNNIEFIMMIKRGLSTDASSTTLKIEFEPTDTIYDIYDKLKTELAMVVGENQDTNTDGAAKLFTKIPRLFLKFTVWNLELLDYFGMLPKWILKASPFHGSVFFSDVGSIGLPAIYHHLYDFGNLPIFISLGAKRRVFVPRADGLTTARKHVDIKLVMDDRICDGFYFSQAYRYLKSILRNPQILEAPPESVKEDIA